MFSLPYWFLARKSKVLNKAFRRVHEKCADDKKHYRWIEFPLYLFTSLIDIVVILSGHFPSLVDKAGFFPPSLEALRSFIDHSGHFLAYSLTVFSGAFYSLSKNYLKRIKVYDSCLKGLHACVHNMRNATDTIVEIKKKTNGYVALRRNTRYFQGMSAESRDQYEWIGKNCVRLLNEATGDKNGIVSVKILREVEATGGLKYYVDDFGSFHEITPKQARVSIDELEIKIDGTLDEATSHFELIARKISQRIADNRPHPEQGFSWDTVQWSNDYQGDGNIFYKPKNIPWVQYFKSGMTSPITIMNEVRGFLCYGSYCRGRLRKYHAQVLAFHADAMAEVMRRVCPHIGRLRDEKDPTKCKDCSEDKRWKLS